MKISLFPVALAVLLPSVAPVLGAPAPKPKVPAPTKAADPLDIPGFAPIPNEFVFAGTQKDVYKLLSRYSGGISLDKLPELSDEDRKEMMEKKSVEDNATLQALLDVKHLLAPIHVIRVRSVSYYALGEAAQDEAYRKLAPATDKPTAKPNAGSMTVMPDALSDTDRVNRGEERSRELLVSAETFYKNMLVKQGGKLQMQMRGETSIAVYAFAQPQTFAVVTRGPSRVIVARADGKPDVGAITGIFQRVVGSR